jgi:hypothetical protein
VRPRNPAKKYAVILADGTRIEFGQAGASDFTIHGDASRKARYLVRHAPNEDWTRAGIRTPGFWARWLLWNRPTVKESLADVRRRFSSAIG